jgi:hypothetical protein
MFKSYAIIYCILFAFSCSSEKVSKTGEIRFSYDSFPKVQELLGQKYIYDSILNVRKILLKGEDLIISNLGGTSKQLHILDRHSLKYKKGVGIIGDGPGEIRSGVWELDAGLDKNSFWAYDLNGKSFYEFSTMDTSSLAKRWIRQNEALFLGYSMHWKSPNEIISYVIRDSYKFGIFDTLGNRKGSLELWKNNEEVGEETGYLLSNLYQGPIEYNPINNILIHAAGQFEYFQIMSLNSGKSISLLGPKNYDIESQGNELVAFVSEETIKGYSDIFVGNKSIFLVYIGKTSMQRKVSGINSDTIFQFDLEGNPIARFSTDFSISAITVSEKDRKIYAVTNDKDPGIAVFEY